MKKTKTVVLTVVILAVVAAGLLLLYHTLSPKGQAGEKTVTIAITGPDGKEASHEVRTDAAYLLEALESVAQLDGEETAQGYTLYGVDGVRADFTKDSAYWAIYVNGEYGVYSLDKQPIADGDSFAIVYETF